MKLLTKEQIKILERNHSGLMIKAGRLAAKKLKNLNGTIAIVCGPGNNGGDGFVVAQELFKQKKVVQIIVPLTPQTQLAKVEFKKCLRLKIPILKAPIAKVDYVIDALFGIGLSRPMPFKKLIEWINLHPVISLDVPSGLNSDTGTCNGPVVRAQRTLTFGASKPGFYVNFGPEHCGQIEVLKLYPIQSSIQLFDQMKLPKRPNQSNKSSFGHTLILSGREGYWGSGLMSSSAAFRVGSGYVTWASFDSIPLHRAIPEALTATINNKLFSGKFDSILVGPGLGTTNKTAHLLKYLFRFPNVIVDADALQVAVTHKLFPFPKTWLITPHAGELAKILEKPAKFLESDRMMAVELAIKKVGCSVLFKGFRSILKTESQTFVIASGNSALAKAGSGDVLGGMIAGLCAQKLPLPKAGLQGAYIHGKLSDAWVLSGRHKNSLMPSDLYRVLPKLLKKIDADDLFD